MTPIIKELVEKYPTMSHSMQQDIEIAIATSVIKALQNERNHIANISTNLCQLCRNSQRN